MGAWRGEAAEHPEATGLVFRSEAAGEAREAGREETESVPAVSNAESPAITNRLMEEICERENLKEAGVARKRKSLSAMARNGSGTSPGNPFPARFRSSISILRGSTYWTVARGLYPNQETSQKAWIQVQQRRLLDKGKIEKLVLALRSLQSTRPEMAKLIRTEAPCTALRRVVFDSKRRIPLP